jgi:hypothetical protein
MDTGQSGDMIDYKGPTGGKIQKAPIEKLDIKHDLDAEYLFDFIESLCTRAILHRCIETICTVPQVRVSINMFDNYIILTEASCLVKSHSHMYHSNRLSQDAQNIFGCLKALLTPEPRATSYSEQDKYTIRRGDVANAVPMPGVQPDPKERHRDGLMFLWCILNQTHTKINTTSS